MIQGHAGVFAGRITRGSHGSDHPGLTKTFLLRATKMVGKLFDVVGETVQNDRILLVVNHVFHFADQARQPRWGEPELEDGKLYPLAVPFADGGKASEPGGAALAGVGNVVGEQNIHRSRQHKRRISGKVTP